MRLLLPIFLVATAATLHPAAAQRPMPPARPGPAIPPGPRPQALPPASASQDARPAWASFGAGVSTGGATDGLTGVSGHITVPLGAGATVLQVGVTGSGELWSRGDEVTEGHVALGASAQSGPLHVTAVAGPSVGQVALSRLDEAGRSVRTSRLLPGVYASVQGLVGLGPSVGIGAEVYGQGNADLSTVGVRFLLAIGSL